MFFFQKSPVVPPFSSNNFKDIVKVLYYCAPKACLPTTLVLIFGNDVQVNSHKEYHFYSSSVTRRCSNDFAVFESARSDTCVDKRAT